MGRKIQHDTETAIMSGIILFRVQGLRSQHVQFPCPTWQVIVPPKNVHMMFQVHLKTRQIGFKV